MLWNLTKNEVEDWMESKMLSFTQEESTRSRLSAETWVEVYIYSDIHEILFAKLPVILHEWLSRLSRRQTNF